MSENTEEDNAATVPAVSSTGVVSPPESDETDTQTSPISPDVGRWISVTDQLPDPHIGVIAAHRYHGVGEAFTHDGNWIWMNGNEAGSEVTHWQPMPAAPAVANEPAGDMSDAPW